MSNSDLEILYRLLISFGIGAAIGLEREYRSKAAGLRTMIMICLGSTIFTLLSISIGGEGHDRIASTIVSGIGFLGAGVIFKDGLTVSGITTATTIWIAAALGMAVGAGEYFIAVVGSGVVLVVLILLEKIELIIDRFHQMRSYKILFELTMDVEPQVVQELGRLGLPYFKKRDYKLDNCSVIVFEIYGRASKLDRFNQFLKTSTNVRSYEY